MCRSQTQGGRRCDHRSTPESLKVRSTRRKLRLAEQKLADLQKDSASRKAIAEQKEAVLSAKKAFHEARDALPFTKIARIEEHRLKSRDRKRLLKQMEEEGYGDDTIFQKQYRTVLSPQNDLVLFAKDTHGRIIGALGAILEKDAVRIHDLWIRDSVQKSGAGTELMAQAAKIATHESKTKEPEIDVIAAVVEAQPFYKRLGVEFNEGSQTGRIRSPEKVKALADKAHFGPPAAEVLTDRDIAQRDLGCYVARFKKTISERADKRFRDYEVDTNSPQSIYARFPELSHEEVQAAFQSKGLSLTALV